MCPTETIYGALRTKDKCIISNEKMKKNPHKQSQYLSGINNINRISVDKEFPAEYILQIIKYVTEKPEQKVRNLNSKYLRTLSRSC